MDSIRTILLASLVAVAAGLIYAWLRATRGAKSAGLRARPSWIELALGFVTNFFDTLGIGSFAPTTAAFRLRKLVPDEAIPGTLNLGHALPSIAQALIFIAVIKVDPVLLAGMLATAVCGSWLGANVVVRLSRTHIQLGMGVALLIAAALFVSVNLGILPGGGSAFALAGWRLGLALTANFVFGALMTLGVGNYGPCLMTLSLLGMDPVAAFPIMTGSSAFLMPVASLRFLRSGRYQPAAALGLTLGGIPGVLIAAYIVKSLPLVALRWLVAIAVTYVAVSMLRSALAARAAAANLRGAALERDEPAT